MVGQTYRDTIKLTSSYKITSRLIREKDKQMLRYFNNSSHDAKPMRNPKNSVHDK
jgi:hypothetical protein